MSSNAVMIPVAVKERFVKMRDATILTLPKILEDSIIVHRACGSWRSGLAQKKAVMLFSNM